MIVLDLLCEHGHRFEGWFASSESFNTQQQQQLVSCPQCGSNCIERQLSAPYVQTRSAPVATPAAPPAPDPAAVLALLRQLGRSAEDVGERFPEEARAIQRGESPVRGIRGKASPDALLELLDEGILALPLPPEPGDLH